MLFAGETQNGWRSQGLSLSTPSLASAFGDVMCSSKPGQVLLLGSGDSGKSTVIKQMRILTKVPWTRGELESYRQIVFSNLIDGMKGIFQSLDDLNISIKGDPRAMDAYNVSCSHCLR